MTLGYLVRRGGNTRFAWFRLGRTVFFWRRYRAFGVRVRGFRIWRLP